jgi:hypothetical protein
MGTPRADEPTFTLRAQDRLMPEVLEHWATQLEMSVRNTVSMEADASRKKVKEARALAHTVRAWQELNRSKWPD